MLWIQAWKPIETRIESTLSFVLSLKIPFLEVTNNHVENFYRNTLYVEEEYIIQMVRSFWDTYQESIPKELIQEFEYAITNSQKWSLIGGSVARLMMILTRLQTLCNQVKFYTSNINTVTLASIEKAFIHLQRKILVGLLRSEWGEAFQSGETRCEKLGAVHLLEHGIWSAKVNASGDRTDLIINDKVIQSNDLEKTGCTLVLTEWKRVLKPNEVTLKIKEATRQLELYSGGILAGFELRGVRYIVLVSESSLNVEESFFQNNVEYRVRNIIVSPLNPSEEARRVSRNSSR